MLDFAGKYEKELQLLFLNIAYNPKYMFYNNTSYRDNYESSKSTWDKHEFVSLDKDNKIIGYFKYSISRSTLSCSNFQIVNFTNDNQIIFGRDFVKMIDDIFTKFNFRKITYGVVIGNPIEKTYDKLTKKYDGKIVGVYSKDSLLIDNQYYDYKVYELFRDNYIASTINPERIWLT